MGLLSVLLDPRVGVRVLTGDRAPAEHRNTYTWDQYLRIWAEEAKGARGGAPIVSDVSQALRNSALWAAILTKAKGIASLPVDVVRYESGARRPVTPMPRIIARPSAIVRARPWKFQLAWSMFTDGNAFGDIVAMDTFGRPTQIEFVNPVDVTEREVVRGVAQAMVGGKRRRVWPAGDLWHVPGEMVPAGSPFGLSPVAHAGKSIGTSLAAEDFGGGFLADGGIPSAILAPDRDPGEEGARRLKDRFMAAVRGKREPVVLPQSVKYTQVSIDPSDSQFIELLRFEVEQVARFTGVPPSMLFSSISGQNVTYANVTDSDLWYLKHTLSYPIDLIEEAMSELIPAPQVVRHNRDAILRADTLARYQAHTIALAGRWRTVNEVRTYEDEPPFDDPAFDEPGIPGGGEPSPGEAEDTSGDATEDDAEDGGASTD